MNGSASPEPADTPSPQLASLTARLTAKLIDLTITAAIAFCAFVTAGILQLHFGESYILAIEPLTDREAYLSITPLLAVPAYQAAVIVMMAWKGKTPGKKLLGIQVVARSGSRPPAAFKSIVRWAVPMAAVAPLVDAIARDFPEFAYLPSMDELPTLSGRVWWLWVAVGWWLLVHASTLWDSQRRGWHDMAAGTIVVKAPPRPRSDRGSDLLAEWQRRRGPTGE